VTGFFSHLIVFVKEKEKEQFCAVLRRFEMGILAHVLNRFQVEIGKERELFHLYFVA
jgi:hypothetical protein